MDLSTLGVFAFLDGLPGDAVGPFARRVEALGYGTLWFTESLGRESFTVAAHLLDRTERLKVASGVAIAYARTPFAVAAASRALAEFSAGRFILGLGVSNPAGNAARGIDYRSPLAFMTDYIAQVKATPYATATPVELPPIVLAALRPRMLALAAAETHGTHTYLMPPTRTAEIRAALGARPWLCAEQAVLLQDDPVAARAAARGYLGFYLGLPAYRDSLRGLGFGDADLADGGSDRLVDALVAWGDAAALRARIAAHRAAGATHVCILPLSPDGSTVPDLRTLEVLAPTAGAA